MVRSFINFSGTNEITHRYLKLQDNNIEIDYKMKYLSNNKSISIKYNLYYKYVWILNQIEDKYVN